MPQDWFSQFAAGPAATPPDSSLSPNDEKRFQSWYGGQAKRLDLDTNPDAPEHFYDYRAAFKAGAKPDETGHWPSEFKREGHPRMVIDGVNTKTGERVAPTGGDDWFGQFTEPTFRTENARDEEGRPIVSDPYISPIDNAIGVGQGLANTAIGLGQIVHYIPGVSRAVDAIYGREGLSDAAFPAAREAVQPQNNAQRLGFAAEQIGEFFVPGGGEAKLIQVPKAALTTLAQTGSLGEAGVSGAIAAAIPGASTVRRAAGALREGAEKTFAQALGPTKEWAKAEARKVAPEAIERGVRGSREAMLTQARTMATAAGQGIDDAVKAAAANGVTVDGVIARGHIQLAKDALMTKNAAGKLVPIEGMQGAAAKLDKLHAFVKSLGDDIPIEQAQRVKQVWDKLVSKTGLYGPKATATAADNADAWAVREAATSFRTLLADASPDLARMNKEFAFWGGLRKVLTETEKRTQAQSGGLVSAGMGGSGAVIGAMSGDSMSERTTNALIGGLAGRQLIRLLQSPAWRTTVSAPGKQLLADALASGQTGKVLHAMGKISASLPSVTR